MPQRSSHTNEGWKLDNDNHGSCSRESTKFEITRLTVLQMYITNIWAVRLLLRLAYYVGHSHKVRQW